jgi:hypothetical protein
MHAFFDTETHQMRNGKTNLEIDARRWTGVLLTLGGLLPLAAVLIPATWAVWGASEADSWRLVTERHGAMTAATWLIWAGVAVSVAGVTLLTRLLGTPLASAALALFATGAGLALVSLTFEATVELQLTGRHQPQPEWYPAIDTWINGLFTAHTALLAPVALIVFGAGIAHTRVTPRWTGWFTIAMAIVLLAQFAAFQGALPAPLFLALIATGLTFVFTARRRPPLAGDDAPNT